MSLIQANLSDGNTEEDLSTLLEKLFVERGWDFRGYKRTSLRRRISKRLSASRARSYRDYCLVLENDPAEYTRLFSTITIKVSDFFREPEVFSALSVIIGQELSGKAVKAWCCACACGEEAYSLAMLLEALLSPEALRSTRVFATDIDSDALECARRASYREESLVNVPPSYRERHFFPAEGHWKVKYNIRNLVKFGALDIVRSPSISGVQVLFCRNLFIYFNKDLQEKVFEKLDYALKPGGILVLGKAEVLPHSYSGGYIPVGERMRIYRKRA